MMTRVLPLILGYVVGVAIGHPGAQAQVADATHAAGHDLTVREIVDVLTEFDFRHADQQPFFQTAYGATNFDVSPPQVWIFNQGDLTGRRQTVIHELKHIHCRVIGVTCDETYIRSEEDRQYQQIYGADH